jgi:hypothetical protein
MICVKGGKKMSEQSKLKLPKPEFIQGEIDYPEMIRKDFRKALLIILLSMISSVILTIGVWALLNFL